MLRIVMLALAMLFPVRQALALEYHLVQWRKTETCEVTTHLPIFGNHFVELAVFPTRWEAERELDRVLDTGQCRPQRERTYDPYGGNRPRR